MAHAYPVYLVVTPFSELAPSVRVLVRTLDKLEPYLPVAEGYYREDTDEALIGLQFDRQAIETVGVAKVLDAVRRCHLPMVVPDRLDPEQHAAFTQHHLSTYHTYVQQYGTPGPGPSLIQRVFTALEEHVQSVLTDDVDEYESMELSTTGSADVLDDAPTISTSSTEVAEDASTISTTSTHTRERADDEADEALDAEATLPLPLDEPTNGEPDIAPPAENEARTLIHERTRRKRATSEWEMAVDGLIEESSSEPDIWQ